MNIVRIIPDVGMFYGRDGLLAILHENKVKNVKRGEYYVFINRQGTAFKVITGEGEEIIVTHYRSPSKNRPISIEALTYLPHYFGGKDAGYNKALEHLLRKKYPHMFLELDAEKD